MPTIAMQTDEGLPAPAAEASTYPTDGVMEQAERQVEATGEEPAQVDGAPAPPEPPAAPEEEEEDDDDVVDVINEALNQLLAKAQEDSEAADDAVAKKREELEAAEADAEEKVERMDELREQARALAEDEQCQGMYHRLRAWSKAQGHCNPRRNWQSKVDAEEKACGNWAGKQRRDERQGKLNPFKKAALDRIGFSFDPRKQGWEEFRAKLEEYVSKNGKLTVQRTKGEKEAGIQRQLLYYQKMPKRMLGLFKDSHVKDEKGGSVRREMENRAFTQDRIDVLTEAGVEWGLNAEQVERMKEKGLNFPVSALDGDVLDQTLVGLEKHAWLTSFEALVEFKKRYGHTYATEFNSSEELGYWASEQRKKMNQLKTKSGGKAIKDKAFIDYQAEMLRGIDFLYLKPDVEWMENYERLSAFKRLFGTVAVTDKFCCFETLHQRTKKWLDENKRFHLKLPTFKPRLLSWAGLKGNVAIPPTERKELLDVLGVFDIPIGDEDIECRKASNYFFRDAEQVQNMDATYLSRVREERRASVLKLKEHPSKEKENAIAAAQELANKAKSLHERCREVALTGRRAGMNSEKLDPEKEREFFLKRGATVAASVAERVQCADRTGKYSDGRPTSLCRISNCFANHAREGKIFLCARHYHMIEVFYRGELRRLNPPPRSDEPASKLQKVGASPSEGGDRDGSLPINSDPSALHSCPSCEKEFASYAEAAKHRKDCGTVEVATEIPLPARAPNEPTWTTSPLPHSATGEAKVLAEHYRRMVWMVTSQYRQKLSEEAPDAKKKHVAIALGDKKVVQDEDDAFETTEVKFPSKADEIESVRLFRRCGGPLAATVSGREKIVREGGERYGDGRRLCFCRVAGCQTEHSTERYLCNWHHAMIGYNGTTSQPRNRKRSTKTSEAPSAKKHKSKPAPVTASQLKAPASVSAYVRPGDTATARPSVPQQPMSISTIPVWHRNAPSKYLVFAPPGKLGLDLANCQDSSYVEVKAIAAASPLKGKVAVGDRIISVCQQLLGQKDVTQVVAILNQNIASVRTLEMMRMPTSGSARETKTGLDATTPRAEGGSSIESGKSAAKPAANSEAAGAVSSLPKSSSDPPAKANAQTAEESVRAAEPAEPSPQSATEPPAKSCEENKTDSSPSAMAVEPPLEAADADVERFMDC